MSTVRTTLTKGSVRADGSRRFAVPEQHLAELNSKVKPRKVVVTGQCQRPWLETEEDFLVGDAVLDLDPAAEYNIHFPYVRGDVNLHSGLGMFWCTTLYIR